MILAIGKSKYQAFTLVEIMVSIAILSLGLIFVIQGFTNALNVQRIAEDNLEASLLAEDKMTEMEVNVKIDKDISDKYLNGEEKNDRTAFQWKITLAPEGDYEELNKVLTYVFWQEGKRKGVSSFNTYLMIPHGEGL